MSTTALAGLRDYLVGTLNAGNLYWLATELTEYAKKKEAHHLKPYSNFFFRKFAATLPHIV